MDAVLLYAFVKLPRAEEIADLGAGSGVVGLLLAKRYRSSRVTLIEIQSGLHRLAKKNIRINGLEDRVEAVKADIRKLPDALCKFDLVVSNPPFRRPGTGRLSPGDERAKARHEIELTLKELVKSAAGLLKHKGRFLVVYHPERLLELIDEMRLTGLEPKRLKFVHGNVDSEAKMVLIEAVKGGRKGLKIEKPLYVYDKDGNYTEELRSIYG